MHPLYSICITNYNTVKSLRLSLESVLAQVDKRFEVIVVDNQSNDGSLEMLKEYENKKRIRLFITHCSIGLGRRIAVEHSVGKYIISQMDMDDVFEPKLDELLRIYHISFEGFLLLVSGVPGVMIAPKKLIERVGGYRDLNYLEDKDLYSRTAQLGRFKFLKSFKIVAYSISNKKLSSLILGKIRKGYWEFLSAFRLNHGLTQLRHRLHTRLISKIHPLLVLVDLIIAFWGFVTHFFYLGYRNDFINIFEIDEFEVKLKKFDSGTYMCK